MLYLMHKLSINKSGAGCCTRLLYDLLPEVDFLARLPTMKHRLHNSHVRAMLENWLPGKCNNDVCC